MAWQWSSRRWYGGTALSLAAAMLVCGETVLKGRLAGVGFLLYWLACLVLTALAMLAALADLRAQRQKALAAQRELIESTLHQIHDEAHARARDLNRSGEGDRPRS